MDGDGGYWAEPENKLLQVEKGSPRPEDRFLVVKKIHLEGDIGVSLIWCHSTDRDEDS